MIPIWPTRDAWTQRAIAELPTLLLDHAHCERKAASTALKLMARYSDRPRLQMQLVNRGGDVPVPPHPAKPSEPPPTARRSRAFQSPAS